MIGQDANKIGKLSADRTQEVNNYLNGVQKEKSLDSQDIFDSNKKNKEKEKINKK